MGGDSIKKLFEKLYLRLFFLLSILISVGVIAYVLFISQLFRDYVISDIERYHQNRAEQAIDNLEVVLQNLNTFGWVVYFDPDIRAWMNLISPDVERNALYTYYASMRTRRMISAEPLISHACLINSNMQQVLSLRTGLIPFDINADDEVYAAISGDSSFHTVSRFEYNNRSYITMIFSSTQAASRRGSQLVLFIDVNDLHYHLLHSEGQSTVIKDADGNIMVGTLDDNKSRILIEYREQGIGESYITSDSNIVNTVPMRSQPWTVYFITPIDELMMQADTMNNIMLIAAVLMLIIQITIIFWSSRRTYRPFNLLAAKVRSKMQKDNIMPDHLVIEEGFNRLENSLQSMEAVVAQHDELMKSDTFRSWITTGCLNPVEHGYIKRTSTLLDYNNIIMVIIRISAYPADVSQKLFREISSILIECLGDISCETVDLGTDFLVAMIGCDNEAQRNKILKSISVTDKKLNLQAKLRHVIAVSDCLKKDADMKAVCEHVYELTTLKFLQGSEKIYTEDDYTEYLSQIHPLTEYNAMQQLIESIKLGHVDDVSPNLAKLTGWLLTLPYKECRFQLVSSIYLLLKTFNKLAHLECFDDILEFVDTFETVNDLIEWLEQELIDITVAFADKDSVRRKEEMLTRVVTYMEENLSNPMLSTEEIASYVSLSPGYLRQIYKDVYGVSISEQILASRIKEVKNLLVTTDKTMTEIAELTGFQTKSHFFTAFKKNTGVTPSGYRKLK